MTRDKPPRPNCDSDGKADNKRQAFINTDTSCFKIQMGDMAPPSPPPGRASLIKIPIVPLTYNIEHIIENSYSSTASTACHTGHSSPCVCHWVKALHCVQMCTTIITSNCINYAIHHTNTYISPEEKGTKLNNYYKYNICRIKSVQTLF